MPALYVHSSPRHVAKRLLIAIALGALILATSHAQQGFPADDSATIKVNFPSTPVQAIIPFYTQITGKKIILDSALQGEPLRIIAPQPLTRREAVAFIEATLLLNGYAIIPVDATTVKLIHHNGGKSPTPEGLKVYNSIKDLPDNEELCHFVMPLVHISPDEASKAFQQVIKLHSYGAIMPMKNAAALIITENSTTIRSIYEIAQVIDVPPAEIANEMIKLERSDAESVAEIISEIYAEEEKTEAAPAQAAPAPPAVAANGSRAPAVNPLGAANTANTNPSVARVKVIPHRRTNSLLVIARPVDITYIRGLVDKLDQQADDVTFLKRKLAYLDVGDFLPVAYNALAKDTDIQNDGADAASGGGRRSSSSRRPTASSNTPSTDASRDSSGLNNAYGQGGQSGFGFNGNGQNSRAERSLLDDPDAVSAPESLVVGKTLLIAEPQSNSLVVSGSPEHIAVIDQLIQEMDVRPQQVYISTIIGQLNLGGDFNYGFDFLNMLDDFTLRQKNVTSPGGGTGVAGALDIPFNLENFGTGSMSFYGQLGSLSRYVNVLEGNKDFKVLSSPSMYTTNNGKAVISSGQRIAVPVNILSNAGINNIAATSASIDYRDVVLKLEVVPLINNDNEVTLRIAQVNDNIVGEQTISGNTVPTIGTQELLTTVTVRDGATVVLGGLITERTGKTERGGIFLRRVPVLKHLFGTTEKSTSRDELLIFIQPKIINSTAHLDSPNSIEAKRSRIMEETLRFGMPLEEVPRAQPAGK
ncbi:secretin N-terminal domain-containing protein [Prosthecobacter dejongeii]|uniref:Type II secretion system protein D n=1 Tax=Prosthecobacter dejongeii TaxID=48465 RepID=A0A7W7YIQ4_9BACT|nr:secretin N-terminal domain-containing protein [Prosthecobacter dejongeii]MBB5036849.1 type II secretion system protein D [Prosthecobacter dejongeii]